MPEYGSWLDLPSIQVAEMMAQTGFDYIIIDLEHGPTTIETAQAQMIAMNGTDCSSIVRIPEGTEAWVKRVLDAGADGVMVPKVENAAQAEAIVSWAFYSPKGRRGEALPAVRASGWGRNSDAYKKRWNESGFVSVQIETVEGLANIEEIAAVTGVTQLFYGPSDYSADAEISFDSEETLLVAAKVAEVAKAHGLACGTVLFPGGTPQALAELGYTHISVASDVVSLSNGLEESLRNAKR